MIQRQRSKHLFSEAQHYLPGGVNSPVRAFKAVSGEPVFIAKAQGSRLWDVDGNAYIDYVLSWGPLILGHAHPRVIEAITSTAQNGTSFGAPTELEVNLAKRIVEAIPSIEMIRMVNSGTEATMSAIRLARAYTQRDKVLKFEGCYHGHVDNLLIRAGSGATTLGIPDSPGVPQDFVKHTLTAPYNDLEAVKKIVAKEANRLACVIIEPIAGNMGMIPPQDGFLEGLRQLTQDQGILLIFDEVLTGFRVCYGGAQTLYRINPDLTCLGKIIGGGLPVGAYGGRQDIMQMVAPSGPVYQAGTLSGNPVAMSAGLATLEALSQTGVFEDLEEKAGHLFEGFVDAAQKSMKDISATQIGSMLCVFFTNEKVINYTTAKKSNTGAYARFFSTMLEEGIYLPPSQFETLFLSTAHSHEDIEKTLEAARLAFKAV